MRALFPRPLLAIFSTALFAASVHTAAAENDLDAAKSAYRAGEFTKVIELTSALENDNEAVEIAAQAHQRRGEMNFRAGKIAASLADFDAFLAHYPERAPHHWQRGISLYYAERYEDGVKQFEIHQDVNSQDVENAVWHFICAARSKSHGLEKARKQFIPITQDRRVPMAEIHALFKGTGSEEQVIDAAESASGDRNHARCYAHLYLGLYHEALGNSETSLAHIRKAAVDYSQPHYMGAVAKVHLKLRTAADADPAKEPSHYTFAEPTRDGIGKFYMGRELSQVVGHGAIRWLERPEREREELPHKVVENMDLKPTDVVADIGAGSGYFTFRVAAKIPKGKALAVDINEQMLEFVETRAKERGVTNVATRLGTIEDTKLPAATVDLAFMVDAYHEFSHPREMMESIVKGLKPGGRVIWIEYRKEDITVPIKPLHKMTQAQVKKEAAAVGLTHLETRDFLPSQHFMIFQKPK